MITAEVICQSIEVLQMHIRSCENSILALRNTLNVLQPRGNGSEIPAGAMPGVAQRAAQFRDENPKHKSCTDDEAVRIAKSLPRPFRVNHLIEPFSCDVHRARNIVAAWRHKGWLRRNGEEGSYEITEAVGK
jgi:hypothetical protein